MRRVVGARLLATLSALVVMCVACGRPAPVAGTEARLVFAAYTAAQEVYAEALIPGFQRHWRERTGQEVAFEPSFDASGAQSRAVLDGLEADVVALAVEADVAALAEAGLVDRGWQSERSRGIASTSVVVIAVRAGNPAGILEWADLARPDVEVLTPDPQTSGGGRWNVCAIYGAALRGAAGGQKYDRDAAQAFLESVLRNVTVMDKGARGSVVRFQNGTATAAITYESEVLAGALAGTEYVIPRSTLLIEHPVAVVDRNAGRHGVREVAEAFVEYLHGPEAQAAFARYGMRPADEDALRAAGDRFRPVTDLWRIGYLGGWARATEEIFGESGAYTVAYRRANAFE